MIDVTQLECPQAPKRLDDKAWDDGTYHQLVPRGYVMVCTYCGQTQKDLRDAAERELIPPN